jgi:hypothetical protein
MSSNTVLNVKYLLTSDMTLLDVFRNRKGTIIDVNTIEEVSNSDLKRSNSLKDIDVDDKLSDNSDGSAKRRKSKSINIQFNIVKDVEEKKYGPQIIDYDIIKTHIYYEKELGKIFCESFFIAGLPKCPKIIDNSESFQSTCGHKDCSILPSFKPEIVYRYPKNDTKTFELNNGVYLIYLDYRSLLPCWNKVML